MSKLIKKHIYQQIPVFFRDLESASAQNLFLISSSNLGKRMMIVIKYCELILMMSMYNTSRAKLIQMKWEGV